MTFNQIKYDLGCRTCKSRRPGISMIHSDSQIDYMSRDQLIAEMNDFRDIECENCGNSGNWLVFKIQLNDNDEVKNQFKLNIIKKNGEASITPEAGYFSPLDIDFVLMKILQKLNNLNELNYSSKANGSAFLMVDFLNRAPLTRVTIIDIEGISIKDIKQYIEILRDQDLNEIRN